MLPNLIIIGAQKCGTTALHQYLLHHPEIYMSREKELSFFVDKGRGTWEHGVEWYKSWFPQNANVKIYGESTPQYTSYPGFGGVPERMHSIIPDAKLIYLVRDPIQRIASAYIQQRSTGHYQNSFEHLINNMSDKNFMVACTKYYMQISRYLPYYPKERLLVLSQEALNSHRQATLRTVFNFLEVDPDFYSQSFEKRYNESSKKQRAKTKIGNKLYQGYKDFSLQWKLPSSSRKQVSMLIDKFFSKPLEKPSLTDEVRLKVMNYFKEDVECLREFTGQAFAEWSM
jgi:hypothetical protein